MFKNPFSFDGRIRRTEYGISFILFVIAGAIIRSIGAAIAINNSSDSSGAIAIVFILYIPLLIFFWAQGAKRCHDMGQSGWMQIIPFYPLIMVFQDGEKGINKYGANPKEVQQTNTSTGGHKPNPGEDYGGDMYGSGKSRSTMHTPNLPTQNKSSSGGEYNGDLY